MTTDALLESIRRWLVFACFLLSLVVAGVGLTASAVDRYSGGQFLAGIGGLLAAVTLLYVLRSIVRTFPDATDDHDTGSETAENDTA